MSDTYEFEWDIVSIIINCLTSTEDPQYPESYDGVEYDEKLHGSIVAMPQAVKHLIVEEMNHLRAIQLIEEEQFKTSINSGMWHAQEKIKYLLQNHLDTIIDLQLNLMREVLALKGLDTSYLDLIFLDNWRFTYTKESAQANSKNEPPKSTDPHIIH